jgi:RND family efflux transporter MFP subunit
MPVEIAEVRSGPWRDASEYLAALRARQSVQVQPMVEGHVTRILVSPGDKVAPGAVLMQIDPARQQATVRSQRAARDANRAAADLARTQRERVRRLFKGGAATRQDLDQAETSAAQAEANAASSEAQVHAATVDLNYYQVTAPTQGTVGDIPVKVGDLVSQQTLLTTLDDNEVLETYLQIPVERAATLKLGTPVDVIDSAGKQLAPSTVSFISPRADPNTQTVLTKTAVDNREGKLRSAQLARVRIVWSHKEGPVVPVLAVQNRAGQSFVWVVHGGPHGGLVAEPRAVQLGPLQEQSYPIVGGLKAGERIVVSGVQKLRPGAPVTSLPQQAQQPQKPAANPAPEPEGEGGAGAPGE